MKWKLRDKPDWLDLKRYDFARRLDAICWYHALNFRYEQVALWKKLRALDKESSYIWVSDDGAKDDGGITPVEFFELYLAQAQDPPGFDLAGTEQVCELQPKTSRDEQALPSTKTPITHYAVDLDGLDEALIAAFKACEAGTQARADANQAPVYPLRSPCELPYDFVASNSMRIFNISAKGERQRLGQFENQLLKTNLTSPAKLTARLFAGEDQEPLATLTLPITVVAGVSTKCCPS